MERDHEEVIVSYKGSVIRARKINGLYKCPFCEALFFTPRDLFGHIVAHATDRLSARREASGRWF